MDIQTLGRLIAERRKALGLTQERLARMAGLSRRTIQSLESGTLDDLGFGRISRITSLLGIPLATSTEGRAQKRGLWSAAKNASVSYRGELSEDMLEHILATTEVPEGFEAHIGHFLDESPLDYVVMAVEEAAQIERCKPVDIWANIAKLAEQFAINRQALWQ